MGKRRKNTKNQTDRHNIENQTIINNHIDYDKLAQAIVKALAEANSAKEISTQEEVEPKQKPSIKLRIKNFLKSIYQFFKLIYYIIFNKKQYNGEMSSGLFSALIVSFLNTIAFVGFGVIVIVSIFLIQNWSWTINNIILLIVMIVINFVVAMFSLVCRGAANEMAVEKDRNYIVAVFSSIVCFVALIVSLIALFKV
ncbi:MAG: hypothetical protein U0O22_01955 [Acutalibacteraceae bacterium]